MDVPLVNITVGEIVVWLIVGALAGFLAGMVVRRRKEGFGAAGNVGVGLIGALIGGFIFDLFNIDLGLGELAISFEDLVAAFLGSLIFLMVVWFLRRRKKSGL